MEIRYRLNKTMDPDPPNSKYFYQFFILEAYFQQENSRRLQFKNVGMFNYLYIDKVEY